LNSNIIPKNNYVNKQKVMISGKKRVVYTGIKGGKQMNLYYLTLYNLKEII
tara:strand:+ start:26 stop:178 length:153 start_codon:yes stop_codon:yes gene_type:complete